MGNGKRQVGKDRKRSKGTAKKAAACRKSSGKKVSGHESGAKKISGKKTLKTLRIAKNAVAKAIHAPNDRHTDEKAAVENAILTSVLSSSHARQLLIALGGENAIAIMRNFSGSQSDDDLSKRLKLKISDVRATLNRLHNEGLVNYVREKNNETGWYSYSWALNQERIAAWIEEMTQKNSFFANHNGGQYYFCRSCGAGSIVGFETAAEICFKCPDCSRMLEFLDEEKKDEVEELFKRKPL